MHSAPNTEGLAPVSGSRGGFRVGINDVGPWLANKLPQHAETAVACTNISLSLSYVPQLQRVRTTLPLVISLFHPRAKGATREPIRVDLPR